MTKLFLRPKETQLHRQKTNILVTYKQIPCCRHIPIHSKLDFSIGEMSQTNKKPWGYNRNIGIVWCLKFYFTSVTSVNVDQNSFPFLLSLCVNFWMVYFQESLPRVKVCTVRKHQPTWAQCIYCLTVWSGELQAGSESILQRQLASADKRYQTAESSLKNGVWIFFGILNVPHSNFILFFSPFFCADDPSGLLPFI